MKKIKHLPKKNIHDMIIFYIVCRYYKHTKTVCYITLELEVCGDIVWHFKAENDE